MQMSVVHNTACGCLYKDDGQLCSTVYLLPVVRPIISKMTPGSVLLDVGCGNGSFLSQFRDLGLSLHGIEMSSSGIMEARKAYPGIEITMGDLTTDLSAHPLTGKCDAVVSTEVVEHVFLPRMLVKNCSAFLKPGGRLIISTPYHGYLKNLALAVTGRMDSHFTALWDYGHIKFWSKRTLTRLLEEAGLEIDQFLSAGRVPYLWKSMVVLASKPR